MPCLRGLNNFLLSDKVYIVNGIIGHGPLRETETMNNNSHSTTGRDHRKVRNGEASD